MAQVRNPKQVVLQAQYKIFDYVRWREGRLVFERNKKN
jgi:hypothetical protein